MPAPKVHRRHFGILIGRFVDVLATKAALYVLTAEFSQISSRLLLMQVDFVG